jgi:hypothetical protein
MTHIAGNTRLTTLEAIEDIGQDATKSGQCAGDEPGLGHDEALG